MIVAERYSQFYLNYENANKIEELLLVTRNVLSGIFKIAIVKVEELAIV